MSHLNEPHPDQPSDALPDETLLAVLTVPPRHLLTRPLEGYEPGETLHLYALDGERCLITCARHNGRLPGAAKELMCRDEDIDAALDQGPLSDALHHLAQLPMPERADERDGERFDVDMIRIYAWSAMQHGQLEALLEPRDEDPRTGVHEARWQRLLGGISPKAFHSTLEIKRTIDNLRWSGVKIVGYEERSCLVVWRRWHEAEAVLLQARFELQEAGE